MSYGMITLNESQFQRLLDTISSGGDTPTRESLIEILGFDTKFNTLTIKEDDKADIIYNGTTPIEFTIPTGGSGGNDPRFKIIQRDFTFDRGACTFTIDERGWYMGVIFNPYIPNSGVQESNPQTFMTSYSLWGDNRITLCLRDKDGNLVSGTYFCTVIITLQPLDN